MFKCPWCGRRTSLSKKGTIMPHIVQKGVRCVAGWVGPKGVEE